MSQEHRPLPPQEQHEPTREERTLTSHDIITHPDARWYHFFPYFGLTIKETIQSLLPYSPLRREMLRVNLLIRDKITLNHLNNFQNFCKLEVE